MSRKYIPRVYTVSKWDFDNTPLIAFPTEEEAEAFVKSWYEEDGDEPVDIEKHVKCVPLFGGYMRLTGGSGEG